MASVQSESIGGSLAGIWADRIPRLLLLGLVIVFVGFPVSTLIVGAFSDGISGGFTLEFVKRVVLTTRYVEPLIATIELAAWVGSVSTVIGFLLAWVMSRMAPPAQGLLEIGIMMPIFTSSFMGAIGWVTLAQPNVGMLNVLFRTLGLGEVDIFTYPGTVFVMSVYSAPYAYALIRHSIDRLNPELEEAAYIAGATPRTTITGIILPLLWPSLLSSFIINFIHASEMFAIPGLLLVPQGYEFLAYSIFAQTVRWPINYSEAAAVGLILLVLTILCIAAYIASVRRQERFITVGPKAPRLASEPNRILRGLAVGGIVAFIFCADVLPVLAIVLRSLLPYFSGSIGLDDLTLDNINLALSDGLIRRALQHSLIVTGVSTVLLISLAFLVALGRVRSKGTLSNVTWMIASIPIAVPGVLFGVGLLWMYIGTPVYATLFIIILVMLARFLPILVRMFENGLIQLGKELEEAAEVCGATGFRITREIRLPLLWGTMRSAIAVAGTQVFNELSASALLFTTASSVLPVVIFQYMFDGDYSLAAALAVIQIVTLAGGLALVLIVARLLRSRAK